MADYLRFPIRSTKLSMSAEVKQRVHERTTEFQRIEVIDTFAFGRVLLLDGHIQLAELDERAYHEALVHVPLLSLENPKRALVIGGGDGGVLRELVKQPLQAIDMVEIDAGVIEASKEYLPFVSYGAFDDPRVKVHIADAFGFLRNVSEPYDLIVMDITDVYEEEDGALSERLFTDQFHLDCKNALSASGFLVTQADNLVFCPYSLEGILETFGKLFAKCGSYWAIVPSFGGFSGYAWASNGAVIADEMPPCRLDLAYLNGTTWRLALQSLEFRV